MHIVAVRLTNFAVVRKKLKSIQITTMDIKNYVIKALTKILYLSSSDPQWYLALDQTSRNKPVTPEYI